MENRVKVGIIGAGNISEQYLYASATFPILEVVGIADLMPERAEVRAAMFGIRASTIEALLADPEIELLINLTIPAAHGAVSHAGSRGSSPGVRPRRSEWRWIHDSPRGPT